jgi:hypothetical protein
MTEIRILPRRRRGSGQPLDTKPWGARQLSVLDCCGNRVTFVEGA